MASDLIPQLLLAGVALYGVIGVVFAAYFVARGAASIDPIIKDTPLRTRVLFAPGAAALWPALLIRRLRAGAAS